MQQMGLMRCLSASQPIHTKWIAINSSRSRRPRVKTVAEDTGSTMLQFYRHIQ